MAVYVSSQHGPGVLLHFWESEHELVDLAVDVLCLLSVVVLSSLMSDWLLAVVSCKYRGSLCQYSVVSVTSTKYSVLSVDSLLSHPVASW